MNDKTEKGDEYLCYISTAGEGRERQIKFTAENRQVQRGMTPNAERKLSHHRFSEGVV